MIMTASARSGARCLQADLRWRDLDAYADIHRRLRRYPIDKIRTQAGNPARLQHSAAELQ
jgi:hypothetical protein